MYYDARGSVFLIQGGRGGAGSKILGAGRGNNQTRSIKINSINNYKLFFVIVILVINIKMLLLFADSPIRVKSFEAGKGSLIVPGWK